MKIRKKIAINLIILSLISPMICSVTHADQLTNLVNKNTQSVNPTIHKNEQQESKQFDKSHQSLTTALRKISKFKAKTKVKPVKYNKKIAKIHDKNSLSFTQKIKYHFHKIMSSISHVVHHNHRIHKARK